MSEDLYRALEPIRNAKIDDFIEEPLLAKPDNRISEIIGLLKENNAYQVFIEYNDKIVSLNVRDILEYKNVHTAKPSMVGKVIPALKKGDTLAKAAGLLGHYRLRALPVVEDGIIGQINSNYIIKHLNSIDLNIKASSLMTPNPIMIRGEEKAAGAKNIMVKNRIDHLPVVEDKKALAIVTSSHLVEILVPPERPDMMTPKRKGLMGNLNFEVKGIADKDVITVDISDSIRHVVDVIMDRGSSYTLVTLSEEVQGIITVRDLVGLMQEMVKDEIPAYIVGLPEDPVEAELAKSKFLSTLQLLRKSHPDILEARCRIKVKDVTGERRRYEVDIHVITPKENVTYTDVGWDLANTFDNVSNALKRHLDKSAEKYKKGKGSIRYAGEEQYKAE
ncbi:MAG: hypothetical protein KatS3mg003_0067 [Candidatus Nitrosocaldaceae archaeon]|nr:MAG: hypothetical protein KatS3mg003_0067 [Candidatus Nitrosocaldaceae archaeon]